MVRQLPLTKQGQRKNSAQAPEAAETVVVDSTEAPEAVPEDTSETS
jgi:hypothetical protein